MLTLVNSNTMQPPIAPVGLEALGEAMIECGEQVELLDLCLARDSRAAIADYFAQASPEVVAISFRNVDDCFLAQSQWFVDPLRDNLREIRRHTDAPIVLGGIGFSLFPAKILEYAGADFGIRGDGEAALGQLLAELRGDRRLDRVDGLVWRDGDGIHVHPPAQSRPDGNRRRELVDNRTYFRRGGQIGLETKRGCPRRCAYCPEPNLKGRDVRLRPPHLVADEVEALWHQGIDCLHTCDSEFNLPLDHARDVCDALIGRGLGERVRWYAYLAIRPLDRDLLDRMRRAGCVGINFTSDSASPEMLRRYRQPHAPEDIQQAVQWCREAGIAVMLDLLLGGPGETPETARHSIDFFKKINPDCAGVGLGVRLYPGTEIAQSLTSGGESSERSGIRRTYDGPIDLLRPTFYVSPALGDRPAALVRDLIGDDPRFFPPEDETSDNVDTPGDHNYNGNEALLTALANGERGAYWDILRRHRP